MMFVEDHWEGYETPEIRIQALTDTAGTRFLLLDGPEPDVQWERFVAAVEQICQRLDVRVTVGFNSIPMAVPHTRPLGVTAHASRRELIADYQPWLQRCRCRAARCTCWSSGWAGRPRRDGLRRARAALPGPDRLPGGRADDARGGVPGDRPGARRPTRCGRPRPRCGPRSTARSSASEEVASVVRALEEQYDAYVAGRERRTCSPPAPARCRPPTSSAPSWSGSWPSRPTGPTSSSAGPVDLTGRVDRFQRRHPAVGFPLAVVYKFFDDQGNYLTAMITYYAFLSMFPLLLLLTSVLGFVLHDDPGAAGPGAGLGAEPVAGASASSWPTTCSRCAAARLAVVIGLLGGLYGSLGRRPGRAERVQQGLGGAAQLPAQPVHRPAAQPDDAAGARHSALVVSTGLSALSRGRRPGRRLGDRHRAAGRCSRWPRSCSTSSLLTFAFRLLTAQPVGTRRVLPGGDHARR